MKLSQTPPPLVMIPGHLLTSELWKQQEQHLKSHYPCILPEIPEAETIREMASMILDQIPESFFLAGLSMGGMIALEILNIASERVLKLALLDTTAGPEAMERSRQSTEYHEDADHQGFEHTIEQ
ncbi:MAG: alpha/beta hydrolase, partial [SAR324 cluster bacterium]|nr:alpha/beta hydrolase [SAR324 cluster bacterium]